MGRRILLLAAAMAVGLLISSARADASVPGVPPSGRQEFGIFRHGEQIGRHVSEFIRSGNRLTVRTHVEIEVKILLVTAFHFDMDTEEQWVDGQLVALRTRADDDGRRRSLDARRDDQVQPEVLRVSYNGHPSAIPAGMLPASLWNPETVNQTELLDILNGKRRVVSILPQGTDTVEIAGRAVPARHYVMRGDLDRDLWYGLDGQLLRIGMSAQDGSQVIFVRQSL
ncbi:MAG: hypothetical protein IRY94_07760 [Rhodospirillaceae bacterium]|nr:hypothetical protein [Rhodospirillaceae bacterium]